MDRISHHAASADLSLVYYSIDVLTNGSEYTGDVATLFLSLWQRPRRVAHPDESTSSSSFMMDETLDHKLLGRYAIAGCGGDLWSRAAADQRFKLASVRAVFCSTPSMMELSMLPALLLATSNAEQLTIVSSADWNRIEELIRLVHGNKQYPTVRTCSLPPPPLSPTKQDNPWWNVYEDEHIIVHGRYHLGNHPSPIMIYIYTFRCLLLCHSDNNNEQKKNSILIIPETAGWDMSNTNIQKQPHAVTCDLPIISIGTEKQIKCCVTLLTRIWIQNETSQSMVPLHSDEWQVLMTPALTKDHRSKVVDPGLLSRAQQQTRMWRNHCDKDTLPYFPFLPQSSNDVTTCRYDNSNRHWLLWTGTSIVFHDLQQRNGPLSVMVVDRHEQRKNQQQQQQQCDSTDETKEQTPPSQNDCGKESWPNKLAPFLHYQNKSRLEEEMSSHIDENEIDIDNDTSDVNLSVEEHSHHAKFYNSPYILVLGTGCASPSPYRGASGYALVLPVSYNSHGIDATVVAIDTGEGFCTQWNRYAGNVPLSAIKVIWISHAHWDHYGGMINVLKLINETCMNKAQSVDSNRTLKRPRASTSPVVVAPKKVLAFLRIMLGDRPDKYYRAVASDDARSVDAVFSSINLNHETTFGYHDPKTGLSPFLFWENIRVDHSCYQSYGFVFGLKGPMVDDSSGRFSYNGTPIIVSYSGDTRPSANLVQSCRRRMAHHDSWRLDLLIHEATFDESRKEMALIKKHSTVQEAIRVGQSLDSRRLLLTHFSQRYCHFDHISEPMKYIGKTSVGFALDGIIIQLSPSEHKVIRHRLA